MTYIWVYLKHTSIFYNLKDNISPKQLAYSQQAYSQELTLKKNDVGLFQLIL